VDPSPPPTMGPPLAGAGPPRRTPRGARVATIVALVLVVVAAGVGIPAALLARGSHSSASGRASSAPAATLPAASAVAAYQQALAATRATTGFHYVAVTAGGGGDQRIVGDAGPNGGTQVITFDSNYGAEQFTLVLASGTVYFQGNAPALEDQLGVAPAASPGLQGKWISVSTGDGPYNVLAPGITIADQVQQLALMPTSAMAVKAPDGTAATRILGTVPPQNGGPAGTGRLDVLASPYLPISFVSTVTGGGGTVTSTTTFSGWGTPPSVAMPSGAVAWSTLGASPPSGGFGGGGGQPPPSPPQIM
jgi:hypothetical protein